MPIREYRAKDADRSCTHCRTGFETIEPLSAEPIRSCPKCGAPVERAISAPVVGASKSAFDSRAKQAGFHKLKKTGKGEYEKLY